nr:SufD family Fe-S cluster assembly protein [uncultured Blautia sp.]
MSLQVEELENTDSVGLGEVRNITINRLPARTWNHLKMNEMTVKHVKVPVAGAYDEKVGKRIGINLSAGLEIHQADENEKIIFDHIETALGSDMDKLGEKCPVEVISNIEQNKSTCAAENRGKEDQKTGPTENYAIFNLTSDGSYGRYFLRIKRNSRMNLAVYCTTMENQTEPFFLQLKIYAEENAHLDLSVVQTVGKNLQVFSDIGGVLEKNAAVDLVKMELGGKEVYSGAYMDLKGDTSSFKAHIGYLGEEKQRLDMNYVARHHGKKTESLMESSGVLSGEAFKLFRGTIDFVKGCQGSVGNEKEDVLLLGDDVVNQTIPLILCAEEDVEGNHGASIGELDEKTLFYLMSRGFTREAASQMIARARLDAIANQIMEPSIREKTLKYLEERL